MNERPNLKNATRAVHRYIEGLERENARLHEAIVDSDNLLGSDDEVPAGSSRITVGFRHTSMKPRLLLPGVPLSFHTVPGSNDLCHQVNVSWCSHDLSAIEMLGGDGLKIEPRSGNHILVRTGR